MNTKFVSKYFIYFIKKIEKFIFDFTNFIINIAIIINYIFIIYIIKFENENIEIFIFKFIIKKLYYFYYYFEYLFINCLIYILKYLKYKFDCFVIKQFIKLYNIY